MNGASANQMQDSGVRTTVAEARDAARDPDAGQRGVLQSRRSLTELGDESSGQLATEWVLVTAFAVMPMVLTIPFLLGIISTYFHRIADVVGSPFP